jgi:hypothetical protein
LKRNSLIGFFFLKLYLYLLNFKYKFLEYTEISNRVNFTRFMYYWSVGAFNIRDPKDNILVDDRIIEHVSIRIYKPVNISEEGKMIPTIVFFHGGSYFLGNAGLYNPTYLLLIQISFFLSFNYHNSKLNIFFF